MVRSLFGNSNRKLRSTFWGSPFIPAGTNQTECCSPLTNFSVSSRFQTHATQIRPFLDSNRNWCGISTVNWQIAYHYALDTPTGFFCQMVSSPCVLELRVLDCCITCMCFHVITVTSDGPLTQYQGLRGHMPCILVGTTQASQECGQIWEKPCYTVNRVPLTKNNLCRTNDTESPI